MTWMTPSFFSSGTQSSRTEVLLFEAVEQDFRNAVFVRVRDEFATEELFEGATEILPGDLVFSHQESFNGFLCLPRFLPGAVQTPLP